MHEAPLTKDRVILLFEVTGQKVILNVFNKKFFVSFENFGETFTSFPFIVYFFVDTCKSFFLLSDTIDLFLRKKGKGRFDSAHL